MDKKVFVKLNPEQLETFEKIKRYLGLAKDAEVIRYLIADFYNRNFKGDD